SADDPDEIRRGDLVIDEATYTARLRGRILDLTFKEFELLKFLAQHPGRVFTRAQLLQEVWGYDYFGGTRTIDVHVRRLRAKLGTEHESLIGTVRNVGYRFVMEPVADSSPRPGDDGAAARPEEAEPPLARHRVGPRGGGPSGDAPRSPTLRYRTATQRSYSVPERPRMGHTGSPCDRPFRGPVARGFPAGRT